MPLTTYPVTPWSGPQPAQAGRTASAKCWVMGVVQFFIGLVLLGLGGTLFFASSNYNLCIAYWYPLWGAALYVISGYYNSSIATDSSRCLVSCSAVSSCLSFFASLIGTVLLARDLVKVSFLYPLPGSSTVFLYCERSHLPAEHCRRFLTYELGLLLLMIIFTVFEMTISSIMFSYSLKDRSLDHQPTQQAFPLLEAWPQQDVAGTSPFQLSYGLPPPYTKENFPSEHQDV